MGVTRWAQLHDTVTNITTDFDGAVNFGSVLYPSTNASSSGSAACTVDPDFSFVPIAETNGMAVVNSMPAPETTSDSALAKGGTPAHDGLVIAYDAIDDAVAAFPDNPAFVILITDGAANCNTALNPGDSTCGYSNDLVWTYDQRLQPLILAEQMNSIDTYVVGIGMVEGEKTCADETILNFCSDPWKDDYGTDFDPCTVPSVDASEVVPWDRLNDLADAGGVPQTIQMAGDSKFYNADDPQALNDALNNILGQLTSCELELTFSPPNPENPNSVEVYVDDPNNPGNQVLVPQADCSMAGQNGWWYPNAPGSYQEIELGGTYCDSLLATGQAEIDFFCDAGGRPRGRSLRL
jgi:hypothetical protein